MEGSSRARGRRKAKLWQFLTMNSTSGSTGELILADPRVRGTEVVFWQEHHYLLTKCHEARARLDRGGRHGCFGPVKATEAGGTSGGVAIATLKHVGHSPPTTLLNSVLVDGRMVARHIHGFLPGVILVICVYMPLPRGSAQLRAETVQRLGAFLARVDRPFVVAGDWNCMPSFVADLGLPARLQATVVHAAQLTCHTPTVRGITSRCLDFFLSDVLLPLIRRVDVRDFNARAHCAVQLTMASFAAIERVRVPRCPVSLPQQRPFGPDLPHTGWEDMPAVLADSDPSGLRNVGPRRLR